MKFLCVDCDSSMALTETRGPENGSMTVVFTCRSCERQIAMLTNAQETQMVHSLGVKIGGRKSEPSPMETIRGSLVGASGDGSGSESTSAPEVENSGATQESSDEEVGAKCPFSSMVVEGMAGEVAKPEGIQWTPEAEERLKNIPSFIRSMVKRGIEDHAKAQGVTLIDKEVMASVRENMGM